MNTTGVQNYLSNVFRPIYTYDTATSNFTPRLELSNIDTYSGNTISVFTASVGDANSNVYVGSNAGNPFNFTRSDRNLTVLGFGAASNISNSSNSVFIGYYAGANVTGATDVISIGANSIGGGSANIFIGTNTGTVGTKNVLIGHYITPSNVSNQIRIGYSNQIPIAADLSTNWVGLGGYLSPVHTYDKLDVSGNLFVYGAMGLNTEPGVETTLDINGNFQSDDGSALLQFKTIASNSQLSLSNYVGGSTLLNVGGLTKSSGGFSSIQGSIDVSATATTIGTLKRGIVLVSAINQSDSTDYAARMVIAFTTSNYMDIGSNVFDNDASIRFDGSAIQIDDTANTTVYDYSITYFPLP